MDATRPTRISEPQQRFPLPPLRGSLPGRSGGCSSPGMSVGSGTAPHRHGCPQGRRAQGGSLSLWRQRGNGGGEGGRVCPGAGERWGWDRGATLASVWCFPHRPRHRRSFLSLPGAGRHRSHAGGREAPAPGPRQPLGLDLRLAPLGKGGSRPQKPRPWGVSRAPSCRSVCSEEGAGSWGVLALGPLWGRWDTTAATCRFPLPRAGAAGEELRCCDLYPPPRERRAPTPDKLYLKTQQHVPSLPAPHGSQALGWKGGRHFAGHSLPAAAQPKSRILEGFPVPPSRQHTVTEFFFPSSVRRRVKIPGYAPGVYPDTPRPRPA